MNHFARNKKKGATLVEVLVTSAIFGTLSIVLLSMIVLGANSWRKVESRYQVESDLQRTVADVNYMLRNSDISSFSCSDSAATGRCEWIAFKSASSLAADGNLVKYHSVRPQNFVTVDQNNDMVWSHFVIYYLEPSADNPALSSIRRLIVPIADVLQTRKTAGTKTSTVNVLAKSDVLPAISSAGETQSLLLAKDVLDFKVSPGGSTSFIDTSQVTPLGTVTYYIKCLKRLEGSKSMNMNKFNPDAIPPRFILDITQSVSPLNS